MQSVGPAVLTHFLIDLVLICRHKGLLHILLWLYLVVQGKGHQVDVIGFDLFDHHVDGFVFQKDHIRTQPWNLSE